MLVQQPTDAAKADLVLLGKLLAESASLEACDDGLHLGLTQPLGQAPYSALTVRRADTAHQRRTLLLCLLEPASRHLQLVQEVGTVGVVSQQAHLEHRCSNSSTGKTGVVWAFYCGV